MNKRDVRPFVDSVTRDTLYKLSFVSGVSVKKLCEDMCNNAIKNGLSVELSPYFRREIQIDGAIYKGNRDADSFEYQSRNIERISFKLTPSAFDYVYELSKAMECSIAKVVGYAVEKSMSDYKFLDRYIKQFLSKKVDDDRMNILLGIVKTVNDGSVKEDYNVASLLLYIADEYRRLDIGLEGVIEDSVREVR